MNVLLTLLESFFTTLVIFIAHFNYKWRRKMADKKMNSLIWIS